MENLSTNFLQQVCNLLDDARKNVKTAVNLSMVYTYYNIGRMITEEEQKGNDRADYCSPNRTSSSIKGYGHMVYRQP